MQALGTETPLGKGCWQVGVGGVFFQVPNEHFGGPTACHEKLEKWPPSTELCTKCRISVLPVLHCTLHSQPQHSHIPTRSQAAPAPLHTASRWRGAWDHGSQSPICNHSRGSITTTFNFPAGITFLMSCCYNRNVNAAG